MYSHTNLKHTSKSLGIMQHIKCYYCTCISNPTSGSLVVPNLPCVLTTAYTEGLWLVYCVLWISPKPQSALWRPHQPLALELPEFGSLLIANTHTHGATSERAQTICGVALPGISSHYQYAYLMEGNLMILICISSHYAYLMEGNLMILALISSHYAHTTQNLMIHLFHFITLCTYHTESQ